MLVTLLLPTNIREKKEEGAARVSEWKFETPIRRGIDN